ncbi:lipid A biosynthesis acyltransferase [Candidatus Koribacter versatilis Ellin345]|uniref:Lipid A biosynthesis acyltransferase n=1 Tax=Koribacter versatilis (strain Ellin345) TaxID=204669 RepID=Q1IP53_KORVE|nr:lipid A biosynthesis acyltransferase [Candidatus Koribacter versatilis Ellin345]
MRSLLKRLEYAPVWLLMRAMALLPRPLARAHGIFIGYVAYLILPRLRRVGRRNLQIAFPDKPERERNRLLRGMYVSLGRLLAEFCLFPRYNRQNVEKIAVYAGFENFEQAEQLGKGVLLLTGHVGGWEIGSFVHSIYGHPMNIVVRPLDNPYLNQLAEDFRCRFGNRLLGKQDFARGLLAAMHKGETVGILMDTNMTPPQGDFVPFFGVLACTATGMARVAMKTGAAVVPAFTVWDDKLRKYRVLFEPAIKLVNTGNTDADVLTNTALFNKAIEDVIRRYPDQWLWVHRRWKTRPPGEPSIY